MGLCGSRTCWLVAHVRYKLRAAYLPRTGAREKRTLATALQCLGSAIFSRARNATGLHGLLGIHKSTLTGHPFAVLRHLQHLQHSSSPIVKLAPLPLLQPDSPLPLQPNPRVKSYEPCCRGALLELLRYVLLSVGQLILSPNPTHTFTCFQPKHHN